MPRNCKVQVIWVTGKAVLQKSKSPKKEAEGLDGKALVLRVRLSGSPKRVPVNEVKLQEVASYKLHHFLVKREGL